MNQLHIVTIKKQGLTMPELWIPGIFESEADAMLYIASLDDELGHAASINSYELSFTFFIVEKLAEEFLFAQTSTDALGLIETARESLYDPIVYLVRDLWQFKNGEDKMGTLEHFHIDDEMDLAEIEKLLNHC
jgi:hypothetical protein